jgi:hypothetical protein
MDSTTIIFFAIVALVIQGYYLRYVFMVTKTIENQEKQILLLTRIAQKLGVEPEKLEPIIKDL